MHQEHLTINKEILPIANIYALGYTGQTRGGRGWSVCVCRFFLSPTFLSFQKCFNEFWFEKLLGYLCDPQQSCGKQPFLASRRMYKAMNILNNCFPSHTNKYQAQLRIVILFVFGFISRNLFLETRLGGTKTSITQRCYVCDERIGDCQQSTVSISLLLSFRQYIQT